MVERAMPIFICHSQAGRTRRAFGGGWRLTAAAAALLIGPIGLASAEPYRWGGPVEPARPNTQAAPGPKHAKEITPAYPALKQAHVARLRSALHLTSDQQRHWLPVEAALNDLVRRHAGTATDQQLQRLKTIATPLIVSLDDDQKREAIGFARRMGYASLVAAY